MDELRQTKARKVALVHLGLSLLLPSVATVGLGLFSSALAGVIWTRLCLGCFILLQPQFLLYLLPAFQKVPASLPDWLMFLLPIFFIPVWSGCFGWLFARRNDWLDHFPFPGKKAFEITNRKS